MIYFAGCSVFRCNHILEHHGVIDRPIKAWTLNFAASGCFSWSVDGSTPRTVEGPVAFWTWPGPHYCYGPSDVRGWDHYYISWLGHRARDWQAKGLHPRCDPAQAIKPISDPLNFRLAFEDMLDVLAGRGREDPFVVHKLEGLLLLLHSQNGAASSSHGRRERVEAVVDAVRAQPERDWDFQAEARHTGIGVIHFRRLWKTLTGTSPVSFVNKARVERAVNLLCREDMGINEISERVGYGDPGYFSRTFRKIHNMSPGSYRAAYRELE